MLWYKAWLETRTRFWLALAGVTALCTLRVYELDRSAAPWTKDNYFYYCLHAGHQILTLTWIVAVTLLLMGGLLRERALGTAAFTLGLPVSRSRWMGIRIATGILQAFALIVVPWAAMFLVAASTGPIRSFDQPFFYIVLLAGGGAVLAGAALLVSSLVEGEYLAPMISLGFVLACGNAPRSLDFINPLAFMGGAAYMAPSSMLIGPIPWVRLAANLAVGALLVFASMKALEKRDF